MSQFSFLKSHRISLSPPFSKGEKREEFFIEALKSSPPFEKGGREGFLARPFQSAKVLRYDQ
jgi:hypothetical protein